MSEKFLLLAAALVFGGFFIGFLSGLLGKGGGLLFVPLFWFSFPLLGIPEHVVVKSAIATSAACMTITSSSAALQHLKSGLFKKKLLAKIALGALPGVLLGAYATAFLVPPKILKVIFASFLFLMSLMLFKGKSLNAASKLGQKAIVVIGFAAGFFAGLLGIGGGSILTPFLNVLGGVEIKVAMATNTGIIFLNSAVSTLSYVIYGLGKTNWPFLGYVYLPALLFIAPSLYIGTSIGARLMHRLNAELLRKMFALFLFFVCAEIVLKAL